MEGDAVEPLEAEYELVKQEPSLLTWKVSTQHGAHQHKQTDLVKGADESVSFVESEQDIERPF